MAGPAPHADVMTTEISDADLVTRSASGDIQAFGALLARHERGVVAAAAAACGDLATAEDLAQEAFVVAWTQLPTLRDRSRPGSWLRGIARVMGKNHARRRARQDVAR